MAENQLDKKTLQKEIKELRTALKKAEDNASKKKEKIAALQAELDIINKEIETTKAQIAEKETLQKKAEYSSVLDKLDNAALSTLSKRQAEQLAKMIISGDIAALLGDDDTKVATSSNDDIKDVDTNINEKSAFDTSSNAMFNKKEGV